MKKSQIFIFDIFVAFLILLISLLIFFSYFVDSQRSDNLFNLNLEIMNGFTQTKINDLNNVEIRKMFISGEIRNVENSIAQQVAEFYSLNKIELAENLSKIYLSSISSRNINFLVSIKNGSLSYDELYSYSALNSVNSEEALRSSSLQRTIFIFSKNGANSKTQKYTFKIELWS
ncbi:hypothetical protein EOM09_04595 [bacterium]|nr:hypothetical protein [bacterium]